MIGQLNNNDLRRYVRESIKAALVDEGFDQFVGNGLRKIKKLGKIISDYADKEWEDENGVPKKKGSIRKSINSDKTNESRINSVIKEEINRTIDNKKFSIAMDKLFRVIKDYVGYDDIRETIAAYFWDDWDGESKIVPCVFDEKGMFYLTYDLCNYDYICLNDDGTVNIKYSNHTDVAKIIAPYLSKENGLRIVHNLYGR